MCKHALAMQRRFCSGKYYADSYILLVTHITVLFMRQYVRENVLTQIFQLRRNKGAIFCPVPQCNHTFNPLEAYDIMTSDQDRPRYISILQQILANNSNVYKLR